MPFFQQNQNFSSQLFTTAVMPSQAHARARSPSPTLTESSSPTSSPIRRFELTPPSGSNPLVLVEWCKGEKKKFVRMSLLDKILYFMYGGEF